MAPSGAQFTVVEHEGEVVVTVTAPVQGPGGIFKAVPGFRASAQAVAAAEPDGTGR